jgi:hypothetical protein
MKRSFGSSIKSPTRRSILIATRLLRIKDATPQVGYDFTIREISGHHDSLSKPSPLGDKLDPAMKRIMTTVIDCFFRTSQDDFEVVPWDKLKNRLSTRSGELPSETALKAEYDEVNNPEIPVRYDRLRASEGIRARTWDRHVNISDVRSTFAVTPSGRVQTTLDREDFSFEHSFKPEIELVLRSKHPPTAEVIGLKEPLKLRVITVSDAVLQYYGSGIQKDIWQRLQRSKIFHLTHGKSVTEMMKVMNNLLPTDPISLLLFTDEQGWVSGDYKGATDSIPQCTTRHAARILLSHYAFPAEYTNRMTPDGPVREPTIHCGLKKKLIENLTAALLEYRDTLRSEYIRDSLHYLDRKWGSREDWWVVNLPMSVNLSLQADTLEFAGIFEAVHTKVSDVLQKSGQLMGNILSFPLLCIINLSTYLLAIETYGPDRHPSSHSPGLWVWNNSGGTDPSKPAFKPDGTLRDTQMVLNPRLTPKILDDLPVLVNGDDISFYADRPFYDHWSAVIGRGGFIKSVGKNYFSPHFMTINSEVFVASQGGTLTKLQITNYGLLRPDFVRNRFELEQLSKEMVGEYSEDHRRTYQLIQREILGTSAHPEAMNRLFIDLNSDHMDSFNAGQKAKLNPFVDIELGGLGLSKTGLTPQLLNDHPVTAFQRILAGRIRLLQSDGEPLPRVLRFHPTSPSHDLKTQIISSIRETERFHELSLRSGFTSHGYLFKPVLASEQPRCLTELEDTLSEKVHCFIKYPTLEGRARAVMSVGPSDEWLTLPPEACGRLNQSNRKKQVQEILEWATAVKRSLSKAWIDCQGGDPTDSRTRRVTVSLQHAVVIVDPGPDPDGIPVSPYLWPTSDSFTPSDLDRRGPGPPALRAP